MSGVDQLATLGVAINEDTRIPVEMPDSTGCVRARREEGAWLLEAWVRPGLDELLREDFALWAVRMFEQLLRTGAREPLWFPDQDEGWQSWTRDSMLTEWAEAGYPN